MLTAFTCPFSLRATLYDNGEGTGGPVSMAFSCLCSLRCKRISRIERASTGTFLVVQWLVICLPIWRDVGSIPGPGKSHMPRGG